MAKPLVAFPSPEYIADVEVLREQGHDLAELVKALDFLVNRKPSPKKYRDHQLSGIWRKSRDFHIEPDWLFIYTYWKEQDTSGMHWNSPSCTVLSSSCSWNDKRKVNSPASSGGGGVVDNSMPEAAHACTCAHGYLGERAWNGRKSLRRIRTVCLRSDAHADTGEPPEGWDTPLTRDTPQQHMEEPETHVC
ncbi:MAG: type II toxin-antitoxin system YafQ family toxin [Desulfovibrio sp.]|jgi:mRNA interferase YafQ|nr:type II toxin-antitoxin system YafQ family toxin [Desulfovibrio sp.]